MYPVRPPYLLNSGPIDLDLNTINSLNEQIRPIVDFIQFYQSINIANSNTLEKIDEVIERLSKFHQVSHAKMNLEQQLKILSMDYLNPSLGREVQTLMDQLHLPSAEEIVGLIHQLNQSAESIMRSQNCESTRLVRKLRNQQAGDAESACKQS